MPLIHLTDEQISTLEQGLDYYYDRIAENYEASKEETKADNTRVENAYDALSGKHY